MTLQQNMKYNIEITMYIIKKAIVPVRHDIFNSWRFSSSNDGRITLEIEEEEYNEI